MLENISVVGTEEDAEIFVQSLEKGIDGRILMN